MYMTRQLSVSAMLTVALLILSQKSTAATDCKDGNALDCYTQALQNLQRAENDLSQTRQELSQARQEIVELQTKVKPLYASVNDPTTGLVALGASNNTLQATVKAVDGETKPLRPGGQGCILVHFGDVPAGWSGLGTFGVIQQAGVPWIFSSGGPGPGGWNWTHGTIACAK